VFYLEDQEVMYEHVKMGPILSMIRGPTIQVLWRANMTQARNFGAHGKLTKGGEEIIIPSRHSGSGAIAAVKELTFGLANGARLG
jgi:hypothetical protein